MMPDAIAEAIVELSDRLPGHLVLVIPPPTQASTTFDQAKLGVTAVQTRHGYTLPALDPEVFSRACPHPILGGRCDAA